MQRQNTFLTTPLSAGSKTLSPLLHLKVTLGWLLFFVEFSEELYAIIYTDSIQKMSTREFTSSERSSMKKAFVVPSQQGMSVCIKKKNGDEEFYLIDSSYHAKPWEKVNLKKALLTTYQDPMGKEFIRISLQPTRKNIIQVIKNQIYILLNIQSLCHSRNSGLGRYFWGVVNFLCRIGSKY